MLLFPDSFDAPVYFSVVDVVNVGVHVHFSVCMQNSDVTAVGFQCGIIRDRF